MKAVFAGSFDPFTVGHLDLVERAAPLFEELVILVARNTQKKYAFAEEQRVEWISKSTAHLKNVRVEVYEGLTVDFMKSVGAKYLVRGIRNASDFDVEQSLSVNNKNLYNSAETLLLMSAPEHLAISSSVVRELLKFSAPISGYVPECIRESVEREWGR